MDTAPRAVPGKNGGTLTPFVRNDPRINLLGGRAVVPLALRILAKETRNGVLLAKRIVDIALGNCGIGFTGADQLRALTYAHEKILLYQQQANMAAPVIDWDALTDDERSRLLAATALVSEIAERQNRESADRDSPPP